jgi:hypothetical protein
MKRLMIVSLAVLCVAALLPQSLSAGFGIKGGYALSNFTLTSAGPIPFAFQNLRSPVGGIFFSLGFGPLAIQPEVLYVRMGGRDVIDGSGLEFWFDYIQVPVLLKLNIIPLGPISPFICAGGYGSYLFRARGVTLVDGVVVGDPADLGDNYEKYDYGVIGGGGLKFKLPGISISIEGRYNYGLRNIWIPVSPEDDLSWKNRSMMALVSIGF